MGNLYCLTDVLRPFQSNQLTVQISIWYSDSFWLNQVRVNLERTEFYEGL